VIRLGVEDVIQFRFAQADIALATLLIEGVFDRADAGTQGGLEKEGAPRVRVYECGGAKGSFFRGKVQCLLEDLMSGGSASGVRQYVPEIEPGNELLNESISSYIWLLVSFEPWRWRCIEDPLAGSVRIGAACSGAWEHQTFEVAERVAG
jgi:hypothetical protein